MGGQKRKAVPPRKKTSPHRASAETPEKEPEEQSSLPFPIVGIGASAGGLEAFTQLLGALPADTGMGFVLVQHLAPTRASLLAEILSRSTTIPVMEVRDEPVVKANHIYVMPPDQDMIISEGALQLRPRKKDGAQSRPIDQFLRSLASDQGHKGIGVILSGTGSDGTVGLEEIKAEGGITFAQDDTAQYDGMPHSAIASGCVDFVLAPAEIAKEIARVGRHPYVGPTPSTAVDFGQVLQLLRNSTGVDFTCYKGTTLQRRITRRMVLKKMEGLKDYARLLQKNPGELEALYQDILISVTSFFRNPEVFETLKTEVFPNLFKNRSPHDPIRVWVVGCSTGEEAYSLAMSFTEFAEARGSHVPVQIFATDLNATAIEKARAGIYSKNIEQDVSPKRLERFFAEVDGSYRIHKSLRDMSVFARHNVLVDPPFSHMDLISCRNLLIYLEPETQQKIVRVLHYGLNPKGVLVLGGSETVGTHREQFEVLDARQRIYSRKPGPTKLPIGVPRHLPAAPEGGVGMERLRGAIGGTDIQREAERVLLSRYAPPGVLIDAGLEIVQVRGDTGPYLSPAPGKASLNLMKMAREGLQGALRTALHQARKEETPVRQEGLRVKSNGGVREVNLEVIPVRGNSGKGGGFLVLFEQADRTTEPPATRKKARGAKTKQDSAEREIARLNQELSGTREYLQSLVEQKEAANEELQSANEEAQSANEELQSVNEELETSKEELQSSNEELATVNDQLQNRNAELNLLSSDLSNLIDSVRMPIVMVGPDLRIRRFSPIAEKVLNLVPADIGRPISQMKLNLSLSDLEPLLSEVVETGNPKETEVRDRQGRWYSLRLLPYETAENKVDGAVMALVDIDAIKRAHYAESIVATVREPMLVLDGELRVQVASRSFYQTFQVTPQETENRFLYELGTGEWRIPELRRLLEDVVPREKSFEDFEVEHRFEHIGRKIMLLNARRLEQEPGRNPLILLAIEDLTLGRQLQRLTEATLRHLPFENLLSEISRYLREALEASVSSVLLLTEDGKSLRVHAGSGLEREAEARTEIPLGQGISGTVAATRTPMIVDDVAAGRLGTVYRPTKVKSVAAVPILSGQELRGVLEVGWGKPRHVTESETMLMKFAAEKAALAVDRQRLLEEQQARRAAEAANEAKDDFLAALSHELRTPMTSILGWTQLLEHASYDPEMLPSAIQSIDRGARTQARLIEDMLDVSRMLIGELSIHLEPVEIRTIMEESVAAAEPAAAAKNIRIEAALDSATVLADPHRLRQVFGNLLSNAIKFSFPNSRIFVAVEPREDHVSVSVTDQGRGIAPEFLPHMFDRFRQYQKGEYGGLGLGLAIARHLVERHGGTIEAKSDGEGKGATFRVVLPTQRADATPPAGSGSPH